jgi:hypothetical protein
MSDNRIPHLDTGLRLKAGAAMFMLSIIVPAAGVPLVASLSLSATMKASSSGALLMGGELIGIAAVAIMGKPGYLYIKTRLFGFLKRYGPPREVSRARYNLGLVMFCIPILFAWLSMYIANYIPWFAQNPLPYAIGGDLLLLASLFVLGGRFWDKVRSLLVHDAVAKFPEAHTVDQS